MIGLVQVGLGSWGREWAARVLPVVDGIELLGGVDTRQEALAEACRLGFLRPGQCFADLEEALAALGGEAVLVTTDLPSHVAAVETALAQGRHVLCEKPFAPSLGEAAGLVELAERLGPTLMVSQNYRFFPAVRAAQSLLAGGSLGQLLHVELDFRRFATPPPQGAPRGHHGWREPLLLDMSIHHFDLLRAVTGCEARSIDCRTWNPAWAGFDDAPEGSALIELDGGATVSYRGSWVRPGGETPWAGEWRMELEHGELWWTSRGDLTAGHDAAWRYDHGGRRRRLALPDVELVDRAGALGELVAALAEGREPESSGRQNLGSLALTYAAIESARRQRPVELAPAHPSRPVPAPEPGAPPPAGADVRA
ncbi:MAG TPA: Gfo/Idh/MocA family oxidoreductase [Acidimicrobiales bacterium]|nr:Gfo/Idh/MocA family oxidoreductase [Acidimicrobiales bacterium]